MRPRSILVAGLGLLLLLVLRSPVGAQESGVSQGPSSTSTTQGPIVTLPSTTTSTTIDFDDEVSTTTTTTDESTSTTATTRAGPVVTLPPTTTTVELVEPPGPVSVPPTTVPAERQDGDGGISTGTLVYLIITALLLIAAVLSVLTWRFWRTTAPTVERHG